jgi:hypothetical protein
MEVTAMIYNYGDEIQGARSVPHPTKRGEYVAEMQPGKIVGFSHPNLAKRDWGWRGSALIEYADGHRNWNTLY